MFGVDELDEQEAEPIKTAPKPKEPIQSDGKTEQERKRDIVYRFWF